MPVLQVRLSDDELAAVKAAASAHGHSVAEHVRQALFPKPAVVQTGSRSDYSAAERAHRAHAILERAAGGKKR